MNSLFATPRRLATALLAVIALTTPMFIVACGDDDDTAPASSIETLGLTVDRSEPGDGAEAAEATRSFAADLYQQLAATGEGENLVFSPHSVSIALAMTSAGAEGETLDQKETVLHAAAAEDIHAAYNALDQALAERSGEYPLNDDTVELELSIVNQLWGQQDFEFVDEFLDLLAAEYGAEMRLVDYINDHEGARELINDWVAEQTRARIAELIPDGVLDDMTRLVLTNAIYLNAPWAKPFDEQATSTGPFTRLDGSEVDAEMMRLDERLTYGEGDGFQAVRLPYVDGSLSMIAVLPAEGAFEEFEASLDGDRIDEITGSLGDAQVELIFPRFEFRTEAQLADALAELGMPAAFEPNEADFSGISTADDLYLQDVVHEAFISVDEEGTEAAAATGAVVGVVSAPPVSVEVAFDRPFFFLIQDEETGAVLFIGRVLDPAS